MPKPWPGSTCWFAASPIEQRDRTADGSGSQARAVGRPCQGDDVIADVRLPASDEERRAS